MHRLLRREVWLACLAVWFARQLALTSASQLAAQSPPPEPPPPAEVTALPPDLATPTAPAEAGLPSPEPPPTGEATTPIADTTTSALPAEGDSPPPETATDVLTLPSPPSAEAVLHSTPSLPDAPPVLTEDVLTAAITAGLDREPATRSIAVELAQTSTRVPDLTAAAGTLMPEPQTRLLVEPAPPDPTLTLDPVPTEPPPAAETAGVPPTPASSAGQPHVGSARPGDVVINEIAWSGTAASSHAGWIELANPTDHAVDLSQWSLYALDGSPAFSLTGIIAANGYFLMEQTGEDSVADIPYDLPYVDDLDSGGETLQLVDASGQLIDTANAAGGGWPAGTGAPQYRSMERISPRAPDGPGAWVSNSVDIRNGHDARGNPINGTPRQPNSSTYPVHPGDVVINEIAWAGTEADPADQWIELFNRTASAVDVTGWQLAAAGGAPVMTLAGTIGAEGYYLIERDDDGAVADVTADLAMPFNRDLADAGESLRLTRGTLTIDTANADGGPWPAGEAGPLPRSMERLAPGLPDTDANWVSNDGFHRTGRDAAGDLIDGTPRSANSSTLTPALLISEVLYAGLTPTTQGDEFVELCNAQPGTIRLTGLKTGDEATAGGNESMYRLPEGRTLGPDGCLVIAKNAAQFAARFGFYPDYELVVSGPGYVDTPQVPELASYSAWAPGNWALADAGDEVLVLGPADQVVDAVAYGQGDYGAVAVTPGAGAPQPDSLQRVWPADTNSMAADFWRGPPTPGRVTRPPPPPDGLPPAADLPGGMHAYWGLLNGHTTYSGGAEPPALAFAIGRANGLHFLAVTDPGSSLSPGAWVEIGTQAGQASQPGTFIALRGYEYEMPDRTAISVWNTAGFLSQTDPASATLPEFYTWLGEQPGALAAFGPACNAAWPALPNDPRAGASLCLYQLAEPSSCASGRDPEIGWVGSLAGGWQLAPAAPGAGTDSRWGAASTWRTGLVAPALTEADVLDALRARRVFATQDASLALSLRSGVAWMGQTIPVQPELSFSLDAMEVGAASQPLTLTLYDRTLPVASAAFPGTPVEWTVGVPVQPGHFYWARAVQPDGDVAQTSPLWTSGASLPERVVLNEILPAPRAVDWDGDGTTDRQDEWLEVFNPGGAPVGLGGWQVKDASGAIYTLPLDASTPAGGYALLFRRQTGLTLNNDADRVTLFRLDGSLADAFDYASGPGYDVSLCRLPDGAESWQAGCQPTPGGANRGLPVPGPLEAGIFEARRLPPGSWVSLRGQLTVLPGTFDDRTAYLQDSSSGIRVYLPKDHRLAANLGGRLEVAGHTRSYHGELQLVVEERSDIHWLAPGDPLPPLPIGTGVMVEPYEGTLVMLSGWVVECAAGGSFWADDGSGWAHVYLDPDAGLGHPCQEVGQPVRVVGVVSQYQSGDTSGDGYRLLPRYPEDIVTDAPPVPTDWPSLLPETGQR